MSDAAAQGGQPDLTKVANKGIITLSVMLATIMQVLDTTIANVALPSMQADLGASADTINWVLTSYIVASAIVTALTGWMADRIGRKQLFLISVAGFVASSVACGFAWSLESMVGFRILQGVFGAAIVPLAQTFLLDINPPDKQGQAMAVWGAGIMVGPIIGPTLGGWLTESFDWRWVFFINLPVGIIAFLGCLSSLPKRPTKRRYFDVVGFAFIALGVGALQMMLDRGAELDWFNSTEVVIEAGLAIIGFWVAAIHIATSNRPFIDPGIFANRNFSAGLVMIFVVGMVLMASMALLPPMLSRIFGYPVMTTGMVMAPRGMGTMVSMLLVGRLMKFVDARILIVTGLLLTAGSLHYMTGFSPGMDSRPVIWSGVVQGMGMGLVFVPLSSLAFATMDASYRADATALFSLVRNIGSSIGISVVTFLLTRNIQVNRTELVSGLTNVSPNLQMGLPTQGISPQTSLAVLDNLVTQQALMIGYLDDYLLMSWMTLAVLPLVLLLRRPSRPTAAPIAHGE
ncbi:MAG: EmrB/QacA family drug resistance transporter [Paracoccus denitrificans]|nr:MAG: EmrB/QacA family drug resistance transporter [Paracoccus denitrificans]PZO82967.1 MAG: EmrB/QacA family drug resistance transporter [Paracoccus denitrificans]